MAAAAEHPFNVLEAARERLGAEPLPEGRFHVECPGCVRLVHHGDVGDHAERCVALKALVVWESLADARTRAQVASAAGLAEDVAALERPARDPRTYGVSRPVDWQTAQPARLPGGAH